MMRKICRLAIISGASACLVAPIVATAECVIPAFIKEGNSYMISMGMGAQTGKVLEIDKQTCWMRVSVRGDDDLWVNVSQVPFMKPESQKAAK